MGDIETEPDMVHGDGAQEVDEAKTAEMDTEDKNCTPAPVFVKKMHGIRRTPLLFRDHYRHVSQAVVGEFSLSADDEKAFPAMPLPGKPSKIISRVVSKTSPVEDAETCSTCSIATQTD